MKNKPSIRNVSSDHRDRRTIRVLLNPGDRVLVIARRRRKKNHFNNG